jgi:N-acetylmuramoyl-L-alanine amidase
MEELLEANSKVDVTYTRKTDIYYWLRANIANRANANILFPFIVINRNTAADGTETYVMGMNKVASNLEAAKENSVITLEDYNRKVLIHSLQETID